MACPSKTTLKKSVADIRAAVAEAGRDPYGVKIFNLQTVIVDETDAKARAKFEDYQRYVSYDGSLVFMSGWTGIDFGQYAPTDLVRKVETNAIISAVEALSEGDPDKKWTVEELAKFGGIGGMGPVVVGSAETVADILQDWVKETDVDGFNLAYAVTPETFEDVVRWLVPELQKRGVYPRDYSPGTLREKLFGAGPYLPATHPAARYRDLGRRHEQTAEAAE